MAFVIPMFAAVASAAGAATAAVGGVGSALSIGAGVLGGASSVMQGAATSKAASYNAQVQDQQAKSASDQAAYQSATITNQTRARQANAEGSMLENGTELSGSNVDILNAIDTSGRLDAMTAVYDGSVQSTSYENQAALSRQSASNAMLTGFIGAGTKIMSGYADSYKSVGSKQLDV